MNEYVFIGSMAEGYYSGASACEGVFVDGSVYLKYQEVFKDMFRDRYFVELDGKHSEVKGDKIVEFFMSLEDVINFIKTEDVDYSEYLIEEELNSVNGLAEEDENIILEHVKDINSIIKNIIRNYEEVRFYLSKEKAEKVREFVSSLND
jgi:hypothetical protein